jgi:D-alanyl-D-alanine carboxypeptidase
MAETGNRLFFFLGLVTLPISGRDPQAGLAFNSSIWADDYVDVDLGGFAGVEEERMPRFKPVIDGRGKNVSIAAVAVLTTMLLLALAVLGPGCGSEPVEPGFDQATIDGMEQAVREVLNRDAIPGAIVGVWVPGRGEWTAALGLADRETGEEIVATDLMRIGSVTKSFTATLVLQLVDEGLLGLDDPLADFFPWVENAQNVTVRMLLNHTSGIVDDYQNPAFWDIASTDPLYKWQPDELLKASMEMKPGVVLGVDNNYSNANYVLLGMIVEQLTGKKLAEAMEEYIFEPLGLAGTVFPEGPEIVGQHSHSYIAVDANGEMYDMTSGIDPSITWAAGAIISTLEDMKIWAQALATGELLEEKTHEEQLQWVNVPGLEGAGVGYQYGLGILKLGNFIGHNGEFSGFQATAFYLPSRDATVVVLINSNVNPTGSQDIFLGIVSILFPNEVP